MDRRTLLIDLAELRGHLNAEDADHLRSTDDPLESCIQGRNLEGVTRLADEITSRGSRIIAGRFELLEKLGEGGMGKVFKARDLKLDRIIALKGLGRTDPEDLQRFTREARTSARLRHPNIVETYDIVSDDGQHFITMKYVEGGALDAAIASGTPLKDLIQALALAADGLDFAHGEGVIHRDIKPANILIDGKGGVFLSDFGLARRQEGESRMTVSGAILGTPSYMAPEQAQGQSGAVDSRSDVYGLGATLYEVLTGHAPYRGEGTLDVLAQIVNDDPVPPTTIHPEVPRDLERVCLKALAREKERRYATAGEFAADLRRYLRGEPVGATAPSAAYRVKRFVSRRRIPLIAAGATLAVVIAGGWILRSVLQSREFGQRKLQAGTAFKDGRWQEALDAASRALEISFDPEANTIAEASRRKLKDADAENRAKLARGDAYRRLQERLNPLAGRIKETRLYFYIRDVDVQAQIRKVTEGLTELQSLADEADDAEVWILLGMGWYFAGNAAKAGVALARAEQRAPEDGRVHYYLGKICLEASMASMFDPIRGREAHNPGLADRAAKHFARAGDAGEEIDRLIAKGYQAMLREEHDTVEAICDEGLKKFPRVVGSEEFWMLRANRRTDSAARIEACGKAIERRPHHPWAFSLRGSLKGQAGDFDGALADLTRAVELNPGFALAFSNRGVTRVRKNDTDGAVADFNAALEIDPAMGVAITNRAAVHRMRGDHAKAIADYTEALRINPGLAESHNGRGIARRMAGNPAGALADFDRAIELEPRNPLYFQNRGMLRMIEGNTAGGRSDFDAAIDIDPGDWYGWWLRGKSRAGEGRAAEAMADLAKAIDLGPTEAEPRLERGHLRNAGGDARGALEDFSEALRIRPNDVDALIARCVLRGQSGDSQGALDDADQAIRVKPDSADAFANRGMVRHLLGDPKRAVEDYTQAIRLDPKLAQAWCNRGAIRLELGDAAAGERDYTEAIRLNPKWEVPYMGRSKAYVMQGKYAESRADVQEALKVAPPGWSQRPQAEKILEMLEGR